MTFMEALGIVQGGGRCTRDAWQSDLITVLLDPMGVISMRRPHDARTVAPGEDEFRTHAWMPGQADMMATDWREIAVSDVATEG